MIDYAEKRLNVSDEVFIDEGHPNEVFEAFLILLVAPRPRGLLLGFASRLLHIQKNAINAKWPCTDEGLIVQIFRVGVGKSEQPHCRNLERR